MFESLKRNLRQKMRSDLRKTIIRHIKAAFSRPIVFVRKKEHIDCMLNLFRSFKENHGFSNKIRPIRKYTQLKITVDFKESHGFSNKLRPTRKHVRFRITDKLGDVTNDFKLAKNDSAYLNFTTMDLDHLRRVTMPIAMQ